MSCSLSHGTKISGSFPFLEVKEGTGIGAGVGNIVSNSASFTASISLIIFSTSAWVYSGSSAPTSWFTFLDLSDILTVLPQLFNSALYFEGTGSDNRVFNSQQYSAFSG